MIAKSPSAARSAPGPSWRRLCAGSSEQTSCVARVASALFGSRQFSLLARFALALHCSGRPRQVSRVLPDHLSKLVKDLPPKLCNAPPLEIQAKLANQKQLCSYKAPWCPESCAHALDTTMMYEAGASALWLDTGLDRSARAIIRHEQPSVATVRKAMDQFFSKDSMWAARATVRGRMVWPLPMEAFGLTKLEFNKGSFDSSIRLLGGHTILMAWYGALRDAILQQDHDLLLTLWECGLTVTLQVQASFERWLYLGH